jgi:ATP-binding cassette subfamily B protein
LSFIQGTFANMLRTSILFLMLYLIFTQRITVGQFFSLFIYSFFIFGPLQELGNVVNTYRETEASLENFETILALKPDPRPEHPVTIGQLQTLAFDDVTFQHQSANRPALQDISFAVSRGETIAFVGPSGSGKTTLVKLLVGLYRPHAGHIYYNGTREDQIEIDSLRERIGFVTQDAQLFSGSIRENLLFVSPNATDAECMNVLRQASVDSLLARAEKGLDTVIGEGGVKSIGRREATSFDCPRVVAETPSAGVRRSNVLTRFSDRGRDQPNDSRCRYQSGCHYDSNRAPPVHGVARRPDLCS